MKSLETPQVKTQEMEELTQQARAPDRRKSRLRVTQALCLLKKSLYAMIGCVHALAT
jgi:uncharacterized protein YigA (DUF484 family)